MRHYGRPVGGADSLSFMYYNEARARREERDNEEGESKIHCAYYNFPHAKYFVAENEVASSLPGSTPQVERVEMYPKENAGNHKTDK